FTYPFLIDFLTAFFIRCGADWRSAFFVENLALALALVRLIEALTLKMFNNIVAARIAPVIFLFNGGLGFINFFSEFRAQSGGLLNFLSHLPKTYTMNADLALASGAVPLRWGNVFTTLLIPQRSMLFGLPFVTMIIALWWMAVEEIRRERGGERGRGSGREVGRSGERGREREKEEECGEGGGSGREVGRYTCSAAAVLRLPPLSTLRWNSRGHVADASLARFFFGGNRMRFDGCSVSVVGLDCVFCPYGRAGRATGMVFERHADQNPVIQTA